MAIILKLLWVFIAASLMGTYNAFLLIDNKTPDNDPKNAEIKKDWHFVGALIFLFISFTAWYMWGLEFVPLALSSFWMLFSGVVHTIALEKPFFFVGTTSKTDILIRKFFPKNPNKGSAIVKITVMVLSLILLYFLN